MADISLTILLNFPNQLFTCSATDELKIQSLLGPINSWNWAALQYFWQTRSVSTCFVFAWKMSTGSPTLSKKWSFVAKRWDFNLQLLSKNMYDGKAPGNSAGKVHFKKSYKSKASSCTDVQILLKTYLHPWDTFRAIEGCTGYNYTTAPHK